MSIGKTVKKAKEFLEPYYSLIGMIIFFLGSIWGIYKYIFRPQDLSVKIEKREVNFPNSINREFDKVYNYLIDSTKNPQIVVSANSVYKYLLNTDNFWTVTLKNETKSVIENIKLRITNVSSLNSWGVSSDYFLENEQDKFLKNISFQEKSGIVYMNSIDELPPNASIVIYLWGKMPKLEFEGNVFVTYKDGTASPAIQTEVYGFKAYLVEYIYEIFAIILIIFIAVYIHAIRKRNIVTV